MDECLYFTNRTFENNGRAMAWVYRPECPSCKKGRLGKPVKKNGKVDKIADYYECPTCKHQVSIEEADNMLKVEVKYTCPKCGKSGETTTEYKPKSFLGVPAYVFSCVDCGEKTGLTKKMKDTRK